MTTKNGDKLSMDYTGTLFKDASQFDSSVGRAPFDFTIGQGQVIKGWDQGLLGESTESAPRPLPLYPSVLSLFFSHALANALLCRHVRGREAPPHHPQRAGLWRVWQWRKDPWGQHSGL